MKIIVASGGTLGHLMPILPVVKRLKELENEVILYTSKNLDFDKTIFNKIVNYKAYGLSKNIFKTVFLNTLVYKRIVNNLKNEHVDLVIGMGGYISGLVISAASKLKIKTIIHEQNSVIGTANKLVLKKVDLLIYSNEALDVKIKNKIYLPNPRSEVAYKSQKIYKKKEKQILIVSGSLGAKTLNEVGLNVARTFKDYQVILITGKRYYDEYKRYSQGNLKIIPKTTNLIKYICESHIVISRAGATTISEIIGSRTVGIYIPSPNVTKDHQTRNCDFILKNNYGIVIREKEISNFDINEYIYRVIDNYQYYQDNLNKIGFNNVIDEYLKVMGDEK